MTDDDEIALYLSAGPSDEYELAGIGFEPDVIYDIGADVGSVTMFAHATYPNAKIVAVEPNPWSFPRLQENAADIPQIVPVYAAIGRGQMYEPVKAPPLHWMVVEKGAPTWTTEMVPSPGTSITLDELHSMHGGNRYVVKMDCEGAEYDILMHPFSRQMVFNSSYFAAEFHFWGSTHDKMHVVVEELMRFQFELAQTHTIYTYSYGACAHIWAKRRTNNEVEPQRRWAEWERR